MRIMHLLICTYAGGLLKSQMCYTAVKIPFFARSLGYVALHICIKMMELAHFWHLLPQKLQPNFSLLTQTVMVITSK